MLDKVKAMLGITDSTKDTILALLIEQAIEYAKSFTHNDDIARVCENAILAMVIWAYNSLDNSGSGVASETYNGQSFTYLSDYPEPLLRTLKANRKVVTL